MSKHTLHTLTWTALAAVAVVLAGSVAGAAGAGSTSAAVTTLYMAPTGSAGAPCTRSQPCSSFSRALTLAHGGTVVQMAAGTYAGQDVGGRPAGGSGRVVFEPARGARVAIAGELSFRNVSSMELRSVSVGDWFVRYSANLVFRNVNTQFFFIRSSSNVAVLGGSVGGIQDGTSATVGNYSGDPPSSGVVIDGVTFHDIGRQQAPGAHVECLFIQEVNGLVLRNSRFTRCDIMDVYASPTQGGPSATNVTMENNWLDDPTDGGSYAMELHPNGSSPNMWTIRYNSFAAGIYIYPDYSYDGSKAYGNVGHIASCDAPGMAFSHNVWDNDRCSSTDLRAGPGFVDAGHFDLHLSATSAALGAGDPTQRSPSRDIDGDFRPLRAAPDAGADQRETALVVPGRSLGAVRLGESQRDVVAFYGGPRRLRRGRAGRVIASYARHRGTLTVTYSPVGTVVAVGTTSTYYTTASGVGVGSPLSSIRRPHWLPCRKVYAGRLGGAAVYVSVAAGGERRVRSFAVAAPGVFRC